MPIRDNGIEPPVYRIPRPDGGLPTTTQVGGGSGQVWTPAAFNWLSLQEYCSQGLSPLIVNGLFLQALREHYRLPDNLLLPAVGELQWTDGVSGLRIDVGTKLDLRQAGQLPAVLVYRGAQRSERAVIGDFAGQDIADDGSSIEDYVRWVNGTTTIQCLAATDGEAEALAQETFAFFSAFAPLFRTYLPFNDVEAMELGEPAVLEDTGAIIRIPLTITYRYEYGWRLSASGSNFNRITSG